VPAGTTEQPGRSGAPRTEARVALPTLLLRAPSRRSGLPTRSGRLLATIVLLGLALCAAACGPPRPLTPQASYDYFCARCHGDDGTGDPRTVGLNPKLDLLTSEMIKSRDRQAIHQRIVQGEGSMPGFSEKLEPHEIDDLVTYTLKRFGPSPGAADAVEAPDAPGIGPTGP